MRIHVIGNKGVVGSATEKVLRMNQQNIVTGSDKGEEILDSDVHLICVPEKAVLDVHDEIVNSKKEGLIVIRSTMRPDFIQKLKTKTARHFCTNPEFLKAQTAFWDCYFPKGVLIGQCCEKHGQIVADIWRFLQAPTYHTTQEEASMIKLLSNVHAAMLITFWNYVKPICETLNIHIYNVARLLPILDERISKYGTIPGSAYGGACLPKDMKQLIALCNDAGIDSDFLDIIEKINSQYSETGISRGGL